MMEPTHRPSSGALTPLALLAAMSGNLMEWYDFGLYGVLAAPLGQLFFPRNNRLVALLAVFGVFAAGYLMRLFGGAFFGHVSDRIGRRHALLVSAVTMAVATSLVGCLPTYGTAGMTAPVLFTLLRLVQGLSVGGEFTSSISYLVEHAPPQRRAFIGSFAPFTGGMGVLLGSAIGNAVYSLYGDDQVLAWAWRVPFLFSIPLGVSLAVLRSALPRDVPTSRILETHRRSPVWTVLKDHRAELLRGALLGWGPNTSFYTLAVFSASFLATEHLLPESRALGLQTASIALMVVLTPAAGYFTDRFGRKPMVLASTTGCLLFAAPLLAILHNGNPNDDLGAELAFGLLIVTGMTPYQVWMAERFPRALRASGLGIAYNIAAGIFGGTTPLVCAALAELMGSVYAPAAYVALAALVSLVVATGTPETGHQPLK